MNPLSILSPALRALPAFLLRWHYRQEVLARKIFTSISGEGEGMTFYQSETYSHFRAWILFSNQTPFPVEIDRMIAAARVNGAIIENILWLDRQWVQPSTWTKLLLQHELTTEQVKRIAFGRKNTPFSQASLDLRVYLNCRVRPFQLRRPEIATANAQFVNFA